MNLLKCLVVSWTSSFLWWDKLALPCLLIAGKVKHIIVHWCFHLFTKKDLIHSSLSSLMFLSSASVHFPYSLFSSIIWHLHLDLGRCSSHLCRILTFCASTYQCILMSSYWHFCFLVLTNILVSDLAILHGNFISTACNLLSLHSYVVIITESLLLASHHRLNVELCLTLKML